MGKRLLKFALKIAVRSVGAGKQPQKFASHTSLADSIAFLSFGLSVDRAFSV